MEDNPIDDAQAQLDSEQQGTPAPSYVTQEQWGQAQQTISRQEREIRGLENKVNRGLDAIRRDMKQDVDSQFARYKQESTNRQLLDMVPEEEREAARALMGQSVAMLPGTLAASPPEVPAANGQSDEEDLDVRAIVEDMGADPSSPFINYAILNDTSRPLREARRIFFDSVQQAAGQQPAKSPPRQQQSAPRGQNPPTDPPPTTAGDGSVSTAVDKMLKGEITRGELDKRYPDWREQL